MTFFIMLSSQTSQINPANYKIVRTEQGLNYVKEHGISPKDYNLKYSIPSQSALVYKLPNGHIVLIDIALRKEYPSFIFYSENAFEECVKNDSFPLDRKDMAWLEFHRNETSFFLTETSFYNNELMRYGISGIFNNIYDCKNAYNKLCLLIKENNKVNAEALLNAFTFAMGRYLILKENYKWELVKYYDVYNPYFQLVILTEENSKRNLHNKVFGAINKNRFVDFNAFYHYCTGKFISLSHE